MCMDILPSSAVDHQEIALLAVRTREDGEKKPDVTPYYSC
jgi:hypothetical protein